ncbi:cyclin-D3-2-like [Zingiber officinale]|uniref:Cyclin-like domain-containing protein n=1 Tax=Zingiber officinale TaxID=94328 RepID=A0A8J5KJ29_ZINOF|nr:cyclin-D3-2-like [Zingiber officinale]KAG6481562.1 hypothetical protein ZIOFF_058166 [Zingiber officinale]
MALFDLLDHLYCQEENLLWEEEHVEPTAADGESEHLFVPAAEAEQEEWTELLCSLSFKEGDFVLEAFPDGADSYLGSVRMAAVEWVVRAATRHGFSALTALLAVNYLDRCFVPCATRSEALHLRDNRPWMGRLAAVACLSLAAKVEEMCVPLLVDLQLLDPPEDGGFLFEPKTIQRMELLVLSALGWRMNPVTPLSFVHHLLHRLFSNTEKAETSSGGGGIARIRALLMRCEESLLSVIADRRWVRYPASVWAAATLLEAARSAVDGAVTAAEVQETRHLISLLNAPKEKVEECYQLILSETITISRKRKRSYPAFCFRSSPPSPSGVIGSCFSGESSCDSWAAPPVKRTNGSARESLVDEGFGEH